GQLPRHQLPTSKLCCLGVGSWSLSRDNSQDTNFQSPSCAAWELGVGSWKLVLAAGQLPRHQLPTSKVVLLGSWQLAVGSCPSREASPYARRVRARIALAVLAAIGSQTPSQQAPAPVFRSSTRLVQVNVVVHDKHGQPVTDLKKEDFTVLEHGKPQAISFFEMDSASTIAAQPAAPLAPDVFTNLPARRGGVPTGITVILVDLVNTGWADQHYAREGLLKFLKQIEPQDRIAIFTLGGRGLTLLHDYTTDAASLVERMKTAKSELSATLDASTLDDSTQQELRDMGLDAIADSNERVADFYTT